LALRCNGNNGATLRSVAGAASSHLQNATVVFDTLP
jgi:hypothetical protein